MATHRWTSSTRLKRHDTGETIAPGEEFEPTGSELRAFGNQIEAVEDEPEPEPAELTEREREIAEHFGEDPDPEVADDEVAFDADAWFDDHDGFEDRIDTVESGVVDDVLGEIEDAERSENVIEAVEARRDELEE